MVWYCSNCQMVDKLNSEPETEGQLFSRYVEGIICRVNGEPDTFLKKVITIYRKSKFTIEKLDENWNLSVLDMNINVNRCKEVNFEWHRKPIDTEVVFRSCAPIQHKKNVVEGSVHCVFRSNSTWQNFDKTLKKNESI